MLWPGLTILLLAAIAGLHLWWRARFNQFKAASADDLEKYKTEQNAARARLELQQEALLNSMAEGLVLLDNQDRILLANQAFLRLFHIAQDVHLRSLLEAVRLKELLQVAAALHEKPRVLGVELKLPLPFERSLQVNGAAIIDNAGQRQGVVLVFHDVTRLTQLENARKDFVANVSHELRTPLSLISGYVETLLDGAKDDPETCQKFLGTIERNAERLRLLIEDLLIISELESGRIHLDLQPVRLAPMVVKIFDDFRAKAQARAVELRSDIPDFSVRADPARLEQVLCNLVDNAIKYGREAGEVIVTARDTGNGMVEVSVQDNGPGIPADSLERIFERFYRVDKGRSREKGGTGLGLAIVKHIIQSHGGRVWAESKPNSGARLYFTLPADKPV